MRTQTDAPQGIVGTSKASPLMAGEVLCLRSANAFHIKANEAYGFSLVALSPGKRVGINVGYC